MDGQMRYRGEIYTLKEINEIREVIAAHLEKSRWFYAALVRFMGTLVQREIIQVLSPLTPFSIR
jgi:hypothetical protein